MRAETLKGHLDGILLAVLEPEPRHGYAIMEALRVRSGGQVDLPTRTGYPALHRLERAGPGGASPSAAGRRPPRAFPPCHAGPRPLGTTPQTRPVAVTLLVTGPLVGVRWMAEAVASHPGLRPGLPWQWGTLPSGLDVGLRLVTVAVVVTAWAAMVGIATTGRLTRWLPARPR